MTRKQKMKQVVCPNCGGSHELPVGYQITNHKNVSVCLGILTRRAEAAEAEAQGWRPVTITEPSQNVMAELLIVGYRGDDGYWHYPDGPDGLVIRGWRPIPTVPQETE